MHNMQVENADDIDSDSEAMLNRILHTSFPQPRLLEDESMYSRTRALLVTLLGLSVSACTFTSKQRSLLDDDEADAISSVSSGRRVSKPIIRFVLGSSVFSTLVTAMCSLLLMLEVMSKETWWQRGARWLAAPALLAAAVEVCSDTADAALSAALLGGSALVVTLLHLVAATLLVTAEVLIWYFIAKFFEQDSRSVTRNSAQCRRCRTSMKVLSRSKSDQTFSQ